MTVDSGRDGRDVLCLLSRAATLVSAKRLGASDRSRICRPGAAELSSAFHSSFRPSPNNESYAPPPRGRLPLFVQSLADSRHCGDLAELDVARVGSGTCQVSGAILDLVFFPPPYLPS